MSAFVFFAVFDVLLMKLDGCSSVLTRVHKLRCFGFRFTFFTDGTYK